MDAGRCLVSAAKRRGQTLIAVTLGDADDWADHKKMLDAGFAASVPYTYDVRQVHIPVVGSDVQSITPTAQQVCLYVPKAVIQYIKTSIHAPHFFYAPVAQDQRIATLSIYVNNKCIKTVALKSAQAAERQVRRVTIRKFWFISTLPPGLTMKK